MRISVTSIEQFNQYLSDPEFAEEQLIERLTSPFVETEYMAKGTAFHDILEKPDKHYDDNARAYIHKNGYGYKAIDVDTVRQLINYDFPFELKLEKDYDVDGETVTVVSKVDQQEGIVTNEFKTCWTGFKVEKYMNSCQWKFYIDIFNSIRVDYLVCDFSDTVRDGIKLRDVHVFSCYPYPEMLNDIRSLLSDFVRWIHLRNLEQFFPDKQSDSMNVLLEAA